MQASPQQLMRRRAEWPITEVARFCKASVCHHGHHATQDSPPTPAGVQGGAHLVNARQGVHDDGVALHGPQQLAVNDVLAARRCVVFQSVQEPLLLDARLNTAMEKKLLIWIRGILCLQLHSVR